MGLLKGESGALVRESPYERSSGLARCCGLKACFSVFFFNPPFSVTGVTYLDRRIAIPRAILSLAVAQLMEAFRVIPSARFGSRWRSSVLSRSGSNLVRRRSDYLEKRLGRVSEKDPDSGNV